MRDGRGTRAMNVVRHTQRAADVAERSPVPRTMGTLFDRYLQHLERRGRSPNTLRCYRSAYKRAAKEIGAIPADEFDLADLVLLHEEMYEAPVLADRTVAYISAALTHAERLGWRPLRSNPSYLVERYNKKPELVEVDRETLLAIREAADHLVAAERIPPTCAAIFRLMVYTGARLSEIRTARWEYVDLDEGVLRLPKSKTGRREVALCDEAIWEFSRLDRISPWCFPGKDPKHPRVEVRRAWGRIVEYLDVPGLRRHDIRHGFATALANAGVPLPAIGELLGHADPRTTARYAHPRVSRLRGLISDVLEEGAA